MTHALLDAALTTPAPAPLPAASMADRLASAQRADRERIARDLHDHVLQRLFAAGLATARVARGLGDSEHSAMLQSVVSDLDDAVREIRETVSALRGPRRSDRAAVSARLAAVVTSASSMLGFSPTLRLAGALDGLPDRVVFDLIAVLREGLMNTARHASANQVRIEVIVLSDQVLVRVQDDGVGLGKESRRSGLAHLRERAAQHAGTFEVRSLVDGEGTPFATGTSLLWSVPLR